MMMSDGKYTENKQKRNIYDLLLLGFLLPSKDAVLNSFLHERVTINRIMINRHHETADVDLSSVTVPHC